MTSRFKITENNPLNFDKVYSISFCWYVPFLWILKSSQDWCNEFSQVFQGSSDYFFHKTDSLKRYCNPPSKMKYYGWIVLFRFLHLSKSSFYLSFPRSSVSDFVRWILFFYYFLPSLVLNWGSFLLSRMQSENSIESTEQEALYEWIELEIHKNCPLSVWLKPYNLPLSCLHKISELSHLM